MYKYICTLFILLMLAASAHAQPIKKGEVFPDTDLKGELSPEQKTYLGLKGNGPWKLSQIDADYIIIEIFSMYCPHCQKEAPTVNDLFERIKKSARADRMKLIGIGVGNSDFEINFFSQKYGVEFPLFEDSDMKIHTEVGKTGTPHFYFIKNTADKLDTLYSHEGRIDKHDDFIEILDKAAGF